VANKNYQSNIKKAKYALSEAEKETLKTMGKMLVQELRKRVRKKTGQLRRKGIRYQLWRKEKSLRIGYSNKGFYQQFFETGSQNIPKDPLLLPIIEEKKDELQQMIKDHLKKELK